MVQTTYNQMLLHVYLQTRIFFTDADDPEKADTCMRIV